MKPPAEVIFVDENESVRDEYEMKPAASETSDATRQSEAQQSRSDGTGLTPASEKLELLDPAEPRRSLNPRWPVASEQEALLISHFVNVVSRFFDFCDPRRHFGRVIPQKARKNTTLASAVLALSARHLSRVSAFDALVADHYYQQCLQELIPAIQAGAKDDSLLAAIVILRFLEEIDSQIPGTDPQRHVVGAQAILRAQQEELRNPRDPTGLLESAHWAALRQDVYIAMLTQRPMQLGSLQLIKVYRNCFHSHHTRTLDDQDADWSNRASLRCCDVTQFVFGDDRRDMSTYSHHRTEIDTWRQDRPESFDPFYDNSDAQRDFPKIKFHADWHVMGHMYNLLAELLLVISHPAVFDTGPTHSQTVRTTNEQARRIVRRMAGIAISNEHAPAARLGASMAIAMCGNLFETVPEQRALSKILMDTEKITGWPTGAASQVLQRLP